VDLDPDDDLGFLETQGGQGSNPIAHQDSEEQRAFQEAGKITEIAPKEVIVTIWRKRADTDRDRATIEHSRSPMLRTT
jgi:hypothetical protein